MSRRKKAPRHTMPIRADIEDVEQIVQTTGSLPGPEEDPLLRPAEVAALFAVNPKTVTRWARDGDLPCIITPGGHRRFRSSVVRSALERGEPG